MKQRIRNSLLALILLAPLWTAAQADASHMRHIYQEAWCKRMNGEVHREVQQRVKIDCLTDSYAIVVDYAFNWAEAIGVSKYYAAITGRQPGIVLIFENDETDFSYMSRLLTAIKDDKDWVVWIIRPEDL